MPQKKKKITPTPSIPKKNKSSVKNNDIRENARNRILAVGDGSVGPKINNMIKSRFRILYIRSYEERRVIDFFKDLTICRGQELFTWDCDRGLFNVLTNSQAAADDSEINEGDAGAVLSYIIDYASKQGQLMHKNKIPEGVIYLLLDFHIFLEGCPPIERKLKEFSEINSVSTIIIVSPIFECPPTLDKYVTLIDFPVPSYGEIKESLNEIAKEISIKLPKAAKTAKKNEEELVKAASGLTLREAENAYAMSVVCNKEFNIQTILDEKKQMIQKNGILEYRDSRFSFDDLGGVDTLKNWLYMRKLAFKDDAREYGLPNPKGILIFGIPGTGKSMICDALASAYKMPLLRLDFGAIFKSHLGESEQNIRDSLRIAESCSPCIFWIDEIEKGIGGVQSSNSTDGGVTSRVFGTMLTWMQDKTSPVFVVCTANSVRGIPPEFMRAGRFDEIFFIDLPNEDQRYEIIQKLISRKGRDFKNFDIDSIVLVSKNYTPVEIEKGIDNALFVAYYENKRELTSKDIVSEIGKFYPLYNSRREEIDELREWALGTDKCGGRAVLANSPKVKNNEISQVSRRLNALDISMEEL